MAWDAADYAVAGVLIAGVVGGFVLVTRMTRNAPYRAASAVALAGALMLIWMNGAVGFIGAPGNDANMLFAGVLMIGAIGAAMARFTPEGMYRTLLAMGLAQLLVPLLATVTGLGPHGIAMEPFVLLATSFFTAIWVLSAWLFRRAADRNAPASAEPQA